MSVFYSEHDPGAAAWLRELIRTGLIPEGEVDERDIRSVPATDLRRHRSVHLFAGIGGWPLALRLAGWPDDRPVWTGSCPCQPFSSAGKGLGDADPRNLWPEMFRLVRECRPCVVFGEQVEGAVRLGWLDGVCADLEGEGYAVGAAVLGAHSAGAPHIRQRLYWVADAVAGGRPHPRAERDAGGRARVVCDGRSGVVADPGRERDRGDGRDVGGAAGRARGEAREQRIRADAGAGGEPRGLGHADGGRFGEHVQRDGDSPPHPANGDTRGPDANGSSPAGVAQGDASGHGPQGGIPAGAAPRATDGAGFWDAYDLIPCRDGKARRVEPGSFPLADGLPGRVGLLRGYGNAIVPQVAAAFIRAFLDIETGST